MRAGSEHPDDTRNGGGDVLRVHQQHHLPRRWDLPELPTPAHPPPAAAQPLGDLVLLDRVSVRLGNVRAVSAGAAPDAVLVADERHLGRAALLGTPWLCL